MLQFDDRRGARKQIIACTIFATAAISAGIAQHDWMFYFFAAVLIAPAVIGMMFLIIRH